MQNTANGRFTCRYWALGPRCPDGVRCSFAHRDTGRLATPTHQPGTCLTFSKYGYCTKGTYCGYEHRYTGVTGLHQGSEFSPSTLKSSLTSPAIELVGFELQIADIAHSSGFNTTNHEALFDLIWTVKRMALKATPGPRNRPPPPPHPIYPDRYRPSGVGDNTNKKRKRNDDVELKFNPVPSLMQKGGTREDPIKLESDDEERVPTQAPKKKVKIANPVATPTPKNTIVDEIMKVKRKLEATRTEVNGCQAAMKVFFDKNSDRFDNDDVLTVFANLAEAMNKAYDGAQDGAKYADKAASLATFGGPLF